MVLTPAERRRLLIPETDRVSAYSAGAYAAAARSGAPMQHAVDVIEPLRAESHAASDAYRLADAYDSAILKVVGEPLLPIMQQLRVRYREAMTEQACKLVFDPTNADVSKRLIEWLRVFGEALSEFELIMCAWLIERGRQAGLPEDWMAELAHAVQTARDDSWDVLGTALERMLAEDIWAGAERGPLLALAALIELYVFENNLKARSLADEALRLAPDAARAVEARAMVHLAFQEREQAEAMLQEFLKRHPDCPAAHSAYSQCAAYYGETIKAEERVQDGLRQVPYASELVSKTFDLYCTPELFPLREARLPFIEAQVVAVDPESKYRNDLAIARAYVGIGQLDKARGILDSATADRPERPEGYVELARIYLAERQYGESREQLQQALAVRPQWSETAATFAELCDAENDLDGAIKWSNRAIEWTVGSPAVAYASLAIRQDASGDAESGWTSALRAVHAAADDNRLITQLQDMLAHRWADDHAADVRAFFDVILDSRGESFRPDYHNYLGNVAFQAGDEDSALLEYQRAVDRAPDVAVYHLNLADSLRRLKRWDEAIASLDRACAINKDAAAHAKEMARLHNDRGNAALVDGRFDEAVADYEAAVQLSPTDAVMQGNLALGLQYLTRVGERAQLLARATDALTEAHRLDPAGDYGVRLARAEERLRRVQRFGELIETPAAREPIAVEFAEELVPLVDPAQQGGSVLEVTIPAMRARLRDLLGFDFPGVRMRGAPLARNEYRIIFFGALYAVGTAKPDCDCVLAPVHELTLRGLSAEAITEGMDLVSQTPCIWAPPHALDETDLAGLTHLSATEMIFGHLADQLRRNAGLFFTLDVAEAWIQAVAPSDSPTDGTSTKAAEDQRTLAIARTLRALVQDQVCIDRSLLTAVGRALDELSAAQMANPLASAAAALETVRASALERSLESQAQPLPRWAEDALQAGRPFTPVEEHDLVRQLEPYIDQNHHLLVQTRNGQARAYLARLLHDRFGAGHGVDLNVVVGNGRQPGAEPAMSHRQSGRLL